MKKLILVAEHSDARLSAILAGHDLAFVRTLDEAKAVLGTAYLDLKSMGNGEARAAIDDLLTA